jgi:hypothetical protein
LRVQSEEGYGDDDPDYNAEDDFQTSVLALSCDFIYLSDDKAVAYFDMEEVHTSNLPLIKSRIIEYIDSERFWWTTFMTSGPHHFVEIQ